MTDNEFIRRLRQCKKAETIGKLIRSKIRSSPDDEINKLVNLIKDNKIDINSFHDNQSILLEAIQTQRPRVVEFLLAIGINTDKSIGIAIEYCYRGDTNASKKILHMLLRHGVEYSEANVHNAYLAKRYIDSTDTDVIKLLLDCPNYDINKCQQTLEQCIVDGDYSVFSVFVDYGFNFNEPFTLSGKTYFDMLTEEKYMNEKMIKKLFDSPNFELNGDYYYFKDKNHLSAYCAPIEKLLYSHSYEFTADLFFDKFMKYIVQVYCVAQPNETERVIKLMQFDKALTEAMDEGTVIYWNEHNTKLIERLREYEKICKEKLIDTIGNKNISIMIYDYCC